MHFAQSDECAVYCDRMSILVACDYIDEHEQGRADETLLTRLQDGILTGATLADSDVLTNIRMLQTKLGVKPTKTVVVTNPMGYRRPRPWVQRHGLLSENYGLYYRTLSLTYLIYYAEAIHKAWDENPIDTVQIYYIPSNPKVDYLRSHRLNRISDLSLHFLERSFVVPMNLLMQLKLKSLRRLELRNVDASENQLKMLKLRLNLEKVTVNNASIRETS